MPTEFKELLDELAAFQRPPFRPDWKSENHDAG